MTRRFTFLLSLGLVGACATTPSVTDPTPGVRGAALTSTLSVHVVREDDQTALAGASVDVGGPSVTTDANGDATLTVTASPATLHVALAGFVGERWMGVDRDHATVGLAVPVRPRPLSGTITAGTSDVAVAAATTLSMLRTSSPTDSVAVCAGGHCELGLSVETLAPTIDVLLVDSTSARLASHVAIDGAHFVIDASAATLLPSFVTLQATIPDAPGLEGVVGVPGIAAGGHVALVPMPDPSTTNLLAPALEGPLAQDRLWFVVRAHASGGGETMIFDRNVVGTAVHLPSSFLAVPTATRTENVEVTVDPDADFYVLDVLTDTDAERVLVLHPSGAHLTLPITLAGATYVALRAVGTSGTVDDLAAAEALADRIATIHF